MARGSATAPRADGKADSAALVRAARVRRWSDVWTLVMEGADVDSKDEDGRTVLHFAAAYGCIEELTVMLDRGAQVDAADKDGSTALHVAAGLGRVDIARVLLDRGAQVKAADLGGSTALHVAVTRGHADIARVLLDHGAQVDATDMRQWTALYYAAQCGHVDIARVLLDRGAQAGATDRNESTVLHVAANSGHVDMVRVLLDRGARAGATDKNEATALHFAANRGHVDVVCVLLDRGAQVDATDLGGSTALHVTANSGHAAVARILLDHGAQVNATSKSGSTALHVTANCGHVDVARVLLDRGAEVDAIDKNESTALHVAVNRGHANIVHLLLDYGAKVDATDKNEATALHFAANSGQLDVVRILLDRGAQVDAADKSGSTALHVTANAGHDNIARVLLDRGAQVDATDKDEWTALRTAANRGHVDVVQVLLDRGAQVDATDKNEWTALHAAVNRGHVDVLRVLLDRGAQVDATDKDDSTVLHVAVNGAHVDVVRVLLDCGANADATDKSGSTALHVAADGGHVDVARVLLDRGAKVDATNKRHWTALHYAAQRGHVDVARVLLDCGAHVDVADKNESTALHVAADGGHVAVIRVLLDRRVHVNATDKNELTALHLAVSRGHVDVTRVLLDCGAQVNATDKNEWTALHFAADGGDVDVVRILLDCGAQVNATEKNESTALHFAAKLGRVDVAQLLLEHGANLDAVDNHGRVPVAHALDAGQVAVVCFLVCQGVTVEASAIEAMLVRRSRESKEVKNADGNTGLHLATRYGQVEMVQMHVKDGADVNSRNNSGKTSLHLAASDGRDEIAQILLQQGAEVDIRDKMGRTALRDAAEGGHVAISRLLVENGADVEATDKGGWSALNYVALRGNLLQDRPQAFLDIARLLISRGGKFITTDDKQFANRHGAAAAASFRLCVNRWEIQQRGDHSISKYRIANETPNESLLYRVPEKVFSRGTAAIEAYFTALDASDAVVARSKICVVGSAKFGKTSLIKALTMDVRRTENEYVRTIGIDIFPWVFAGQNSGDLNADGKLLQHEVAFWDFAGQDVYRGAFSVFYSRPTLYLLCVDLERYSQMLVQNDESELDRFVKREVLCWLQLLFVRQPDLWFAYVGTKADVEGVNPDGVKDDLERRVASWVRESQQDVDSQLQTRKQAGDQSETSRLQYLRTQLDQVVGRSTWLFTSSVDQGSIQRTRRELQQLVTVSNRHYVLPSKYAEVLNHIRSAQAEARHLAVSERVRRMVLHRSELRRALEQASVCVSDEELMLILRTLHDLGDVFYLEDQHLDALKDHVIVDPLLVVDLIRQIVRHDLGFTVGVTPEHISTLRKEGRVSHAMLQYLQLWRELDQLDEDMMWDLKKLLVNYQIAYPAGQPSTRFAFDADLIVPALWRVYREAYPDRPTIVEMLTDGVGSNPCWLDVPKCGWEYKFARSSLPESLFEQVLIASYQPHIERRVCRDCLDLIWGGECAARLTLQVAGSRSSIQVEAAAHSQAQAWRALQFAVITIEQVLRSYPGVEPRRQFVEHVSDGRLVSRSVETARAQLEQSKLRHEDVPTWIPPDMAWFTEQQWKKANARSDILNAIASTAEMKAPSLEHGHVRESPAVTEVPALDGADVERCLSDRARACVQLVRDGHQAEIKMLSKGLDNAAAFALATALRANRTLRSLRICRNNIGAGGARALADALTIHQSLVSLDMSWNGIGIDGARSFADVIRARTTLQTLVLSRNSIGDQGAALLAAALHGNTTLQALHLKSNDIGEEGASVLADAIATDSALISLDLAHNAIGDLGAAAFAEALQDDPKLQVLDLSGNAIGDDGAIELGDALSQNRTLKRLVLRANEDIGSSGRLVLGPFHSRVELDVVDGRATGEGGTLRSADGG